MNINTIKNAGIVTAKVAISAFVADIVHRNIKPINKYIQKTYNSNFYNSVLNKSKITKPVHRYLYHKEGMCSFLDVLSKVGLFIGTYKALNWLENKITDKIIGKSDNIEQSENDALSISAEDEIEAAGVEAHYDYAETL